MIFVFGIVWVDLVLFDVLYLKVGDMVWVGLCIFMVVVVIICEFDCGFLFVNFLLWLMMCVDEFVVMGFIGYGSCVMYWLLVVGDVLVIVCFEMYVYMCVDGGKLCGVGFELL